MIRMTAEFTLKVWRTRLDYLVNKGEMSPFTKNDRYNPLVLAGLHGQVMSDTIYAFEVYDNKTGETVLDSN